MTKPVRVICILLSCFVFCALGLYGEGSVPGADTSADTPPWQGDADVFFADGLKALAAGDGSEKAPFMASAQAHESQAQKDPAAWYDAATAWFCAGEPAKSIADYRRYLQYDWFNQAAWDNLAQARIKAGTQAPGGEGIGSWPWSVWLADAAALLCGIAVLLLGLWMIFRTKGLLKGGIVIGIAALLLGLGALCTFVTRPVIAVAIQEVTGRKGDAEVYQAQPAQPWPAGQEFRVLQKRHTWVQVQAGTTTSWIPAPSLLILER